MVECKKGSLASEEEDSESWLLLLRFYLLWVFEKGVLPPCSLVLHLENEGDLLVTYEGPSVHSCINVGPWGADF